MINNDTITTEAGNNYIILGRGLRGLRFTTEENYNAYISDARKNYQIDGVKTPEELEKYLNVNKW